MGIVLYREPKLKNPVLIAGWSGIGNIGILAVEYFRQMVIAKEFGEIESWEFFDPRKVTIKGSLLKDLEFPSNKFYFQRTRNQDLIFFIGEEQPGNGGKGYAAGEKAYQMANLVLDVAEKFGCKRIYTSGAAVALIHHTLKPMVWAVPNSENLIDEIRKYENTILMSEIEGGGHQGSISGLNGLLLGVAKKRGLEAICLLGEIPYYLQGSPLPYPKASKSVLEVLTKILNIEVDKIELSQLDESAERIEKEIEKYFEELYKTETIPLQIREGMRERIEKLKSVRERKPRPITEDDQKWIRGHIDEFFKKGGRENERPL